MRTAFIAVWTAICLAIVECIICIFVIFCIYAVEGAVTSYSSGVEGVSVPLVIIKSNFAVLVGRFVYGFVPATALVLLLCRASDQRLSPVIIGIINVSTLLLVCLPWEKQFEFLYRLTHPSLPVYENVVHVLVLACFISPVLLIALQIPGTTLPHLQNRNHVTSRRRGRRWGQS